MAIFQVYSTSGTVVEKIEGDDLIVITTVGNRLQSKIVKYDENKKESVVAVVPPKFMVKRI